MSVNLSKSAISSFPNLSKRLHVVDIPVLVTFALFVFATVISGDPLIRENLPLVRFISLLLLALGIYTAIMVGLYCAHTRKRWALGLVSAAFLGLGGGFVWSGASFGFGFSSMIAGILCAMLLIPEELKKGAGAIRRARRLDIS